MNREQFRQVFIVLLTLALLSGFLPYPSWAENLPDTVTEDHSPSFSETDQKTDLNPDSTISVEPDSSEHPDNLPVDSPQEKAPGEIHDPFSDVEPGKSSDTTRQTSSPGRSTFFGKELLLHYKAGNNYPDSLSGSVGFELFHKFSTATRDTGDLNIQLRLLRHQSLAGMRHGETKVELHNVYYTSLNPLGGFGKLNVRAGHFPIPFGLEPEIDTHSTILQLSGPLNFGMKKDWGINAFGSLGPDLDYDIAFTRGSGKHFTSSGNPGLFWTRISTSSKYNRETNSEIGLSFVTGSRHRQTAPFLQTPTGSLTTDPQTISTLRYGLDYRLTKDPLIFTMEASAGKDDAYNVRTFLAQTDYVDPKNRWQASIQYQDFHRSHPSRLLPSLRERTLSLEYDWFLKNTLTNKNILRFNYTRYLSRQNGTPGNLWQMMYYLYY